MCGVWNVQATKSLGNGGMFPRLKAGLLTLIVLYSERDLQERQHPDGLNLTVSEGVMRVLKLLSDMYLL